LRGWEDINGPVNAVDILHPMIDVIMLEIECLKFVLKIIFK